MLHRTMQSTSMALTLSRMKAKKRFPVKGQSQVEEPCRQASQHWLLLSMKKTLTTIEALCHYRIQLYLVLFLES